MNVTSNYQSYAASYASSTSMRPEKPDFSAMAQEMIQSADTDSDGILSADEFTTALTTMTDATEEEAQSLYTTFDTDSSSSLSTAELASIIEAMGPPPNAGNVPPPPPPSEKEESSSEIFSALDSDGDGVISQSEFEALFASQSSDTEESTTEATTINSEDMYAKMLQRLVEHYSSDTLEAGSLNLSA